MLETLDEYKGQLKNIWNNLTNKAKVVIGISTVGIISLLVFLIIFGSRSSYETLFRNLNSEDAAAIVEQLESQGISYQLEDNSTTIKVPEEKVHKARLDMAGEGLPAQGEVGFEIFDQSQFGTTDFEREVNYYRALGGELSRSIRSMRPVEFARVQITPPEDSLFTEDERSAKASVLLKLNSGVSLGESQIKAIANLVANGVQDLEAEQVSIVDSKGKLLTAGLREDDNSQSTGNRMDMEREFENGLKNDLEVMLNRVIGPDNFAVQVQANLNFDQREVESRTYSPVEDEEGIVRSEEVTEESHQGRDGSGEGAPGTSSNLPQYTEEDEEEITNNFERTDRVTNYEINEKLERQVYSPGEVEKLSVSVIVDESVDEENMENIRNSVAAAIGYEEDRDLIEVTSVPFDRSLEEEAEQAAAAASARETRKNYIYGGLIALISLLLFISIIFFRRNREEEYTPGQRMDVEVGDEASAEISATEELTEEEKMRKEMREKLEEMVYEEPEGVAEILKSWLMEE